MSPRQTALGSAASGPPRVGRLLADAGSASSSASSRGRSRAGSWAASPGRRSTTSCGSLTSSRSPRTRSSEPSSRMPARRPLGRSAAGEKERKKVGRADAPGAVPLLEAAFRALRLGTAKTDDSVAPEPGGGGGLKRAGRPRERAPRHRRASGCGPTGGDRRGADERSRDYLTLTSMIGVVRCRRSERSDESARSCAVSSPVESIRAGCLGP